MEEAIQGEMEVEVDSGGEEGHGRTDLGGGSGYMTPGQQTGMGISRKLEGFGWVNSTEVGEMSKHGMIRGQTSSVSLAYL